MKYLTCLAFIALCACGADGEPEQPYGLDRFARRGHQ